MYTRIEPRDYEKAILNCWSFRHQCNDNLFAFNHIQETDEFLNAVNGQHYSTKTNLAKHNQMTFSGIETTEIFKYILIETDVESNLYNDILLECPYYTAESFSSLQIARTLR